MSVRVPHRECGGGKAAGDLGAATRDEDRRDEPQDRRREMVPGRSVLCVSFSQRVRGERVAGCRRMQAGVARYDRQFVRRQAAYVAMEFEFEGRLDTAASDR